jgi:hypothetical protein
MNLYFFDVVAPFARAMQEQHERPFLAGLRLVFIRQIKLLAQRDIFYRVIGLDLHGRAGRDLLPGCRILGVAESGERE